MIQNEASCFISHSCNLVSHWSIFGDKFFFVMLDRVKLCLPHGDIHRLSGPSAFTVGYRHSVLHKPSFVEDLPFPFLYKEMKHCEQEFRDEETITFFCADGIHGAAFSSLNTYFAILQL